MVRGALRQVFILYGMIDMIYTSRRALGAGQGSLGSWLDAPCTACHTPEGCMNSESQSDEGQVWYGRFAESVRNVHNKLCGLRRQRILFALSAVA